MKLSFFTSLTALIASVYGSHLSEESRADFEISVLYGISSGFRPPTFERFENLKVQLENNIVIVRHQGQIADAEPKFYQIVLQDKFVDDLSNQLKAIRDLLKDLPQTKGTLASDQYGLDVMVTFGEYGEDGKPVFEWANKINCQQLEEQVDSIFDENSQIDEDSFFGLEEVHAALDDLLDEGNKQSENQSPSKSATKLECCQSQFQAKFIDHHNFVGAELRDKFEQVIARIEKLCQLETENQFVTFEEKDYPFSKEYGQIFLNLN